ncbi:hypothetical protein B0T20DRAFT_401740 [Sordaria brevicollis]|uniref:Uncharacterized protein n=1 Tax=Sordaria brevicollis TaxID=83679 RepID=A0AAE0UEN0_SORBR|nr:hypothetical protein B0T20DRAFT_401740 [Sordaria brevicollis]
MDDPTVTVPKHHQFRCILANRGVLSATWNADIMEINRDVFGRWETSPTTLPVMILEQCATHLDTCIQQEAREVEKWQEDISRPDLKRYTRQNLYNVYKDVTNSILTLKTSCQNLVEICGGLVSLINNAIASRPKPAKGDKGPDSRLVDLKLLRDGIRRTNLRLKIQLNRIHHLESIHIQATKAWLQLAKS